MTKCSCVGEVSLKCLNGTWQKQAFRVFRRCGSIKQIRSEMGKSIKTNWILLCIELWASGKRGHYWRNTVPPPQSSELRWGHERDWETPFNNELRWSSLEGIRMCKIAAKSSNDRSDFKFSNNFNKVFIAKHCKFSVE